MGFPMGIFFPRGELGHPIKMKVSSWEINEKHGDYIPKTKIHPNFQALSSKSTWGHLITWGFV
jgi:hypothetical protein